MIGTQNALLVAMSMVVAAFSSYTALDISGRIRAARDRATRIRWLAVGTFAFATGLWASQFIGMLAYSLPFPVGYSEWITAQSFLVALGIAGLTLEVSTRPYQTRRLITMTGLATGLGISVVSFLGVQSLRIEPHVEFSKVVFVCAVIVAIAATTAALSARIRLVGAGPHLSIVRRAIASILIGTAIGGSHYIALCAVKVSPNAASRAIHAFQPDRSGYAVIIISIFVVFLTLALSILEFRHERERMNLTSSLDEARRRLRILALFDDLTSLPNRGNIYRRVQSEIDKARVKDSNLHVLYINIDSFKVFNESYGFALGDSLLRELGARLITVAPPGCAVGRIGGDEFAIAVPDSTSEHVFEFARKLVAHARQGIHLDTGDVLRVTLSIGVAVGPMDGDTADVLLKNAGRAMSAAKSAGGNAYRIYSQDMQASPLRRLQIQHALQDALESDGFRLHFQPKFGGDGRSIEGAEALIRWTHQDLGVVPPLEFIPVAESVGLINQIGNWVVEQACIQIREWDREGLPPVRLAVNLSPQQLKQQGLVQAVKSIVENHGLDANRLMFEITETVAMEVAEETSASIREFQAAGFDIAIDDFGTGYSSLAYLQRFRARQLKIDRFFTRGLDDHGDEGYAIVSAIIGLAHTLKMQVVAEGVETRSQLEKLRELRCDQVQGYLLGKPMDAKAFKSFLRNHVPEPA
ncbi:diguanylate cyclase/phosphodiesterase (GGDEF & EAL domains) with PAS/PAC sensor(s) [Burkholderia sp. AU4i]|nr:diguanylate cyclase/phosphodiesterase (GGDEF & EAL domains) with PAS/PAC sensor(s) [Burkholderia sp. AU4i]